MSPPSSSSVAATRSLLCAASLLLPALGCTDGDDPGGLLTHDLDSINALGVSGTLRSHDGCVYLEMPADQVALVFPEGFSLDHETIRDASGVVLATIGDFVETGGTLLDSGAPCSTPSESGSVLFMGGLARPDPND